MNHISEENGQQSAPGNTAPLFWATRAVLAVMAYFGVLYLLSEEEVRSWTRLGRQQLS